MGFAQATYFERLLTRFTVPEELFGPLSIKGLEADKYERLTESYLPTASIAFLDEIFKANSAILNSLLTLLNEREFDNGANRVSTPLVTVVGASNELPQGEELEALYDRFLVRLHVGPVSKERFRDLLGIRGEPAPTTDAMVCFTVEELKALRRDAEAVVVAPEVIALLCDLREWCTAEGIRVSDRRWRKVVKLLQVAALTNGRQKVSIWDCWLLQHCLWSTPESREAIYQWYAGRVGATDLFDSSRLTRIIVTLEGQLKVDQESQSQRSDDAGNLLFSDAKGRQAARTQAGGHAVRDGEPLFLAPQSALIFNNHWRRIEDRSNGGRGFTRAELGAMQVQINQYSVHPFEVWENSDAYLAAPGSRLVIPENDLRPLMEPTRHKAPYIESCLREIESLRGRVVSYNAKLREHVASLDAEIRANLWITPDFAEPAARQLATTQHQVTALLTRVERLRQGFELLPKEPPLSIDADNPELDDADSFLEDGSDS